MFPIKTYQKHCSFGGRIIVKTINKQNTLTVLTVLYTTSPEVLYDLQKLKKAISEKNQCLCEATLM
jgi:hypothetical protein